MAPFNNGSTIQVTSYIRKLFSTIADILFIAQTAAGIRRLPDTCSFEQAALAEPLSVLIHASRRANLTVGQTVLVFGAGTIGLLACALAKSLGAMHVVVIDINRARLDFAEAHGFASQTYCLNGTDAVKTTDEQLRQAREKIQIMLKELGRSEGFDVVFECSGAESSIQMSCHVSGANISAPFLLLTHANKAAVAGGKVVLVGMGSAKVTVPIAAAAFREVDIIGCFRYANTYPTAITLLASGKLKNVEKLITHRLSLEEVTDAFEMLARGQDEEGNLVMKVMITL